MLFDEKTLQRLKQLTLVASQVRSGSIKGERRSTKRGASLEFADYRDYTPGDDIRRLDWNAFARLDRPFIKLHEEEEDLAVHILIDASRSMDWGEGDQNKFNYALRLSAAVGAIALFSGDRLSINLVNTGHQNARLGPLRGGQRLMQMLAFLEAQKTSGQTNLDQALRDFSHKFPRPGLAFLLSDLFSPAGFQRGIAGLQSQGFEVIIVHILSPDELEPPFAGDLRLVDVEDGHFQEVTLDSGLRTLYRQRLHAWRTEIQSYCHKRGVRYLEAPTTIPWDKLVLYNMRRMGAMK